jgi:hypothetical protein
MSTTTVIIKDFAELADYIDIAKLPPGPMDAVAEPLLHAGSDLSAEAPNLDALLAELASASAMVASVAQLDAQERTTWRSRTSSDTTC